MSETPSPQVICRPDGHVTVCPECAAEQPAPASEVQVTQLVGGVEVPWGHTTDVDLSAYEAHYAEQHGGSA